MSEEKDAVGIGVRPSQVLAGALAAVTAALLGSKMGVAGTVLGAGLASVITTVGAALYLRSLERTRQRMQAVRARVGRTPDEAEPDEVAPEPPKRSRRGWAALVAGTVAAFVLGMLALTGFEWVHGGSVSGNGQGTTIGGVVKPRSTQPDQRHEETPGTPSTVTVTVPPSGSSSAPTTSSTRPDTSSESSTTTTTSSSQPSGTTAPTTTSASPTPPP